jgi:hypothetical protein
MPTLPNVLDISQITDDDYEERVLNAVDAYRLAQSTASASGSRPPGFRKVAERFQVDWQTVRNRFNGVPSLASFNRSKSYLSDEESMHIIDYLIGQAKRGFPLSNRLIEEKVNFILKLKFGPKFLGIGIGWVGTWIKRWEAYISPYWTTSLEKIRADALNFENVEHWFKLLGNTVKDEDIVPERTFAMDETGILLGVGRRTKVVGPSGQRVQVEQRGGSREMITLLPPTCADGTFLTPTVIFPGKNFMRSWGEFNPLNCS